MLGQFRRHLAEHLGEIDTGLLKDPTVLEHARFATASSRTLPGVFAESGAAVDCCQVGIWLRDYFADFGLKSFAKTSGSKGLQLYIPLNSAVDYSRTKGVSKGVAQQFEREKPKQVVSQQLKTLREGKVLIDWSQNDQYKTTVNVYSLRAREHPTVSTPVTWDEVEECLSERDPMRLRFTADAVLERVSSFGDLFEPVLSLKQKLSAKLPTTETKKRAPRAGGGRSRQQGQRRPA